MTAASEYDHRRSALTRLASRTGASLRFSDISVDVKGKRVLNGVSGAVERGELLAVMGPSGTFWGGAISVSEICEAFKFGAGAIWDTLLICDVFNVSSTLITFFVCYRTYTGPCFLLLLISGHGTNLYVRKYNFLGTYVFTNPPVVPRHVNSYLSNLCF